MSLEQGFPSGALDSCGRHFPLDAVRWRSIGDALQLTERELQIVQALFDGHKEDDIARRLSISRYTVHTHLGRLYRKLQVDSCTGLLLCVFRQCLLDGAPAAALGKPFSGRRSGL